MYKIDDITKLDLSDKKQYAIAKETLDRYELTQSEKKGLLEGIKNKEDAEYRYFMLNYWNIIGINLESYADELYGCGFFIDSDFWNGINNIYGTNIFGSFDGGYISAFKINVNKTITYFDNYNSEDPLIRNNVKVKDIIDQFLRPHKEDPNWYQYFEITKEEYEQKSEILRFYQTFLNKEQDWENNYENKLSIFFNNLYKLYKSDIKSFDEKRLEYKYSIITNTGVYDITNISEADDSHIVVSCGNVTYNITETSISEIAG